MMWLRGFFKRFYKYENWSLTKQLTNAQTASVWSSKMKQAELLQILFLKIFVCIDGKMWIMTLVEIILEICYS